MDEEHMTKFIISVLIIGIGAYIIIMFPYIDWIRDYWKIAASVLLVIAGISSFIFIMWVVFRASREERMISRKLEKEINEHHKNMKK